MWSLPHFLGQRQEMDGQSITRLKFILLINNIILFSMIKLHFFLKYFPFRFWILMISSVDFWTPLYVYCLNNWQLGAEQYIWTIPHILVFVLQIKYAIYSTWDYETTLVRLMPYTNSDLTEKRPKALILNRWRNVVLPSTKDLVKKWKTVATRSVKFHCF